VYRSNHRTTRRRTAPECAPRRTEFPLPGPIPTRHAATLTYLGKPEQPAELSVIMRNAGERTRRAVLTWLAGWGLAIVAVFLPVLHFILVPLLFLGGPLLALHRLGERVSVLEVSGECPGCGAAQRQPLNAGAKPRLEFRCDACGRAIGVALPEELLAKT
jgi:hypothetical protein